jgi:hypothetical protein
LVAETFSLLPLSLYLAPSCSLCMVRACKTLDGTSAIHLVVAACGLYSYDEVLS